MATRAKTVAKLEGNGPGAVLPVQLKMIPMSDLYFGHDMQGGGVNARKSGREQVESLALSIQRVGLILPLAVRTDGDPGRFYVIDGNRRLAALRKVVPSDTWTTHMVPTIEHETLDGLELSMIANVERADLHPVDRFEVFDALFKAGHSVEAIAQRSLLTTRQVDQALALAGIHPAIRDAWREDKIDADTAKAFTVEPDQDRQLKVYKRNKTNCHAHWVKTELLGDQHETGKLLTFVGLRDYAAAGGAMATDLFADENEPLTLATDFKLLQKLAGEKLEGLVKKYEEQGWKWVSLLTDVPNSGYWEQVVKQEASYTDKDRARAGVIVGMDYSGKPVIKLGMVKPADKAREAKKKEAAKTGKEPTAALSNAIVQRMSETLTRAAAHAMKTTTGTGVALAAIVAGNAAGGSVAVVVEHGLETSKGMADEPTEFAAVFGKLYNDNGGEKTKQAVRDLAARSLNFQVFNAAHPPLDDKGVAALCNALGVGLYTVLCQKFDYQDYFNSVSKPLVLDAIAEATNKDEARKLSGKPKDDVVKFAMANVRGTGWLPKELRTRAYMPKR